MFGQYVSHPYFAFSSSCVLAANASDRSATPVARQRPGGPGPTAAHVGHCRHWVYICVLFFVFVFVFFPESERTYTAGRTRPRTRPGRGAGACEAEGDGHRVRHRLCEMTTWKSTKAAKTLEPIKPDDDQGGIGTVIRQSSHCQQKEQLRLRLLSTPSTRQIPWEFGKRRDWAEGTRNFIRRTDGRATTPASGRVGRRGRRCASRWGLKPRSCSSPLSRTRRR